MNYNKLENIRKGKKITQKELAEKVGISESTYKKNIANENMTIAVLEKIAEILEVPVTEFFDKEDKLRTFNEPGGQYLTTNELREVIKELRDQLRMKDQQIKFLQHLIENNDA